MTLTANAYLGGTTYTVAEVHALRAAILAWLDANEETQDIMLIEQYVQTHMMAGHKAEDI